ncbi:transposase [Streptomyces sp. NPDC126514]|uniref:transposase n=1 Tax=Streptomyces sp. NPDC126514 TaxID=3155210 RepID=UPI003320DF0A
MPSCRGQPGRGAAPLAERVAAGGELRTNLTTQQLAPPSEAVASDGVPGGCGSAHCGLRSDLRLVCTAPSEAAATERFLELSQRWGTRYPAVIRLWPDAWAEMVPFLSFGVEIRKVICRQGPAPRWTMGWKAL